MYFCPVFLIEFIRKLVLSFGGVVFVFVVVSVSVSLESCCNSRLIFRLRIQFFIDIPWCQSLCSCHCEAMSISELELRGYATINSVVLFSQATLYILVIFILFVSYWFSSCCFSFFLCSIYVFSFIFCVFFFFVFVFLCIFYYLLKNFLSLLCLQIRCNPNIHENDCCDYNPGKQFVFQLVFSLLFFFLFVFFYLFFLFTFNGDIFKT